MSLSASATGLPSVTQSENERFDTLDLNDPQNFPVCDDGSGSSFSLDQLDRIVNRIAPQIRTLVFNINFEHAKIDCDIISRILSKCQQLEELVLHEFGSNEEHVLNSLLPIKRLRLLDCDYMDLPENVNRLPLEELEITGRWFYWPDTNVFYNKLHTLSISRSTMHVPDLITVLQRNADTLRCLKLTHNYRLEEYDTADFWHRLPSLVPYVTDLSVCGREISHLTHGDFNRLEVDQPLEEWLVDLLPRFPKLRCFAANYTSDYDSPLSLHDIERDDALLRRCVERLIQMGTLDELHLIVDNQELLQSIRTLLSEPFRCESHLHIFVYARSKGCQSRGQSQCHMKSIRATECNRKHLVDRVSNNRCERQQDLSNILYDDDD